MIKISNSFKYIIYDNMLPWWILDVDLMVVTQIYVSQSRMKRFLCFAIAPKWEVLTQYIESID